MGIVMVLLRWALLAVAVVLAAWVTPDVDFGGGPLSALVVAALVAAANELAQERGVSAGELIRALAPLVGGKGGGKADVAQGGGTDASRLDEALDLVSTEVGKAVGA